MQWRLVQYSCCSRVILHKNYLPHMMFVAACHASIDFGIQKNIIFGISTIKWRWVLPPSNTIFFNAPIFSTSPQAVHLFKTAEFWNLKTPKARILERHVLRCDLLGLEICVTPKQSARIVRKNQQLQTIVPTIWEDFCWIFGGLSFLGLLKKTEN